MSEVLRNKKHVLSKAIKVALPALALAQPVFASSRVNNGSRSRFGAKQQAIVALTSIDKDNQTHTAKPVQKNPFSAFSSTKKTIAKSKKLPASVVNKMLQLKKGDWLIETLSKRANLSGDLASHPMDGRKDFALALLNCVGGAYTKLNYSGSNTCTGYPGFKVISSGCAALKTACLGPSNNGPTDIALTATAINDTDTGTNITVGTLSTTDPDSSDSHTYSLVSAGTSVHGDCGAATSDDDNASFNISGSNLRTNNSLASGSYNICLQTDDGTETFQKGFSIIVNNTSDSDGSLTSAVGVSEPIGLGTTVDTTAEAVDIFDFTFTDGGTADGKAMTVSDIVMNVSGTSTDAERSKVTWRLNGNDASNVTGAYNAGNDTVTFSGLSISIADNTSETYTVNAYFNSNTGIVDGHTFGLSIDGDTDVTVGGSGTQMGTTSAVTNGAGGSFDVVASVMAFTTQPAGSVSGSALTTQPVVTAQDAFGNTDTGFTETITLTEASAGSLTGASQAAVAGVATFTSVDYTATADQQSFTLTANDQDGVGSDLPTVNANAVTSDVVATKLVFDTQPSPLSVQSAVATNLTTVPVISAQDANNVVDTGYSTAITLSEVNGAGSATMSVTGDTDSDGATVSLTPASGVATFTAMQVTYTASGGSSENFNLQASSGGLPFATSSQLIGLVADSDGALISAAGVNEPVGLNTTIDSVGEAIDVFDFTLTDAGTADGLAMTVSDIVMNVSGTSTDAERSKVTWRLNGNDASNVTGVYNAGNDTVTFSGLSISIADNTSETYTVNAYFNSNTGIVDGHTFGLSIDGDTDVTVGGSGTQMGTTSAVTNGAGGSFDVVASVMAFTTQPAGSVSGSAFTTQPVVTAQDAFGNTDTGFTETITLTEASAGSLTGASQAAVAGVATFTSVDYTATADQQSFTLTANDQDGVGSDLPTVNANAVTSDVVATKLVFDTQPSPLSVQSAVATNLTTVPVVSAQDANNVVDTGYSTAITLSEVNGAGSATMSVTGDTDSDGATVSLTPASGVATFTAMQVTYTASGGSSENFNLQASSGGLPFATSSQLIGLVADSDGALISAAGVNEPVGLNTTIDSVGEAIDVFDFTLTDAGTADGLAMTVSDIVMNVSGTSTDAERSKVTWRLNGNDASNVTGVYNAGNDTVTFSGLSISIADNTSETYTVNAYFNSNTGIVDGHTFGLSIDGDTDVTVGGSGTQMGTTSAVTNGAGGSFDVVASVMAFTTQPAGSVSGSAFTTQPVVTAQDAFGNTDTGFTETITLTEASAGSLTGASQAAVAGVATFTSVDYTATTDQQSFTLTANDQDGVGSDLPTVNANAVTSDVVATKLVFDTQPSPLSVQSAVATNLTTVPVVSAQDANNVVDTGYSTAITLAEVNGAGSATMSVTGDTDSDGATVSLTPASGVATFTAMQVTYTASSGANENFNLQASSGGLSSATSSQLTAGSFDTDATVTPASGVAEPVALASFVDTNGEALGILDFTITDGGTFDSKATLVSAIRLHTSGTADASKFTYFLNGPDASNVSGVYSAASDTVTFSGLTISVASGQAEEYTVSAYYNDNSDLTEGQTLILSTDGDTDFTLASDSTKMASTAPVNNGTGTKVDIVASELRFTTQPAGSVSGISLTSQPIVKATDSFGNTDAEFNELITLTENSAGTLTSNTKTAVAGVASFTGLTYTATGDQQSFTLVANDDDAAGNNLATVSANSVISDVVATKLVFNRYLTPDVINSEQNPTDNSFVSYDNSYSQSIIVNAENAAGLVDTDYVGNITLAPSAVDSSSSFTIAATGDTDASTGTVTLAASSGQVVFSDLNIDYQAASASDAFGINASDNVAGTSNAIGSNIEINIAPYVKDENDSFGPLNVDEDVQTTFATSDIEVFDADDNSLTITFSVDRGLLFAVDGDSTQDGVTIAGSNDSAGSQGITLSGTANNINTFLSTDRFQYQTALNDTTSATLTIKANDGTLDGSNKVTETITINAINDSPEISGTPSTSVAEGSPYSFTPTVTDVDSGDTKVFSITNKPDWATFDTATGELTGTPGDHDVDTSSNIVITVTDSGGASASLAEFSITVTNVNDAPLISGTPSTSVVENSFYRFTPTVTDVDSGDTKTFSIANKPNWATFNTATGELSGTPGDHDVGTSSNIVITVTDSGSVSASLAPFSIIVINVNDAPVISGTPSTSVAEDTGYSFIPTATDVDSGDTKTFAIANKPSWATFNTATGELNGTPTNNDVGTSSGIVISVSDGANASASLPAFSITVTNVNDAPVISGTPITSVAENASYSFIPTVTDVDSGDSKTFSIANKPNWATFNTATGELSGTPGDHDVGTSSNIVITVTDSGSVSASLAPFSIIVINVNDAPVISGTPSTSAAEDAVYSFIPTVTDVDSGDTKTFAIANKPSWATFNTATGELSGTPTNNDLGTSSGIVISVSDGANASASLPAFSITVTNVNDAPVISGTPITSVAENASYSFIPTVTDVDSGDTKTFSITNKPSWATFNTATGELSGTPENDDVGLSLAIVIEVTDSGNAKASLPAFSITVTNINDAPVISGTPSTSVEESSSYSFTPTVTDIDSGDTQRFSITNKPSWAGFNTSTGQLSGTPDNNDVGTSSGIVIEVTDSANASASLPAFSITVTNVNNAPVISGTPSTSVAENANYSFIPTVTDVDSGDTQRFSITNKPSWATFNTSTGELSGIPTDSDVGTSSGIIIEVTDVGNASASLPAFSITVTNVNNAPVISGTPSTSVAENANYSFIPTVTDVDSGDTQRFSIANKPSWASFDSSTGELMGTPNKDNIGVTEGIVITVTDNEGLSASLDSFNLEVLSANSAPNAIDDSFEFDRNEQNRYLLNVIENDSDADGDELTVTATNSSIGQVVIENNQIVLTVDSGFIGQVELDYSITDGNEEFSEASVQVLIRGAVDSAPTITVPDDVEINAIGLYSRVDLGIATAVNKDGRPVPVSLLNGPLFEPGNNLAYWQATEEATGLTSVASQKVLVHPLISLSKDQVAIEGDSVTVSVLLNGVSPVYPLTVPFTISGRVDDNDYVIASDEVEIASGTEALININIIDDNEAEGDETLIVTLTDGNLGSKSTHTLTIVERNIAPEVSLAMHQDGESRQLITPVNGVVLVNADISDANNDIVTTQWQYDAALNVVNELDDQLTIDPSNLANGIYSIRLDVTDDGEGNLSANQTLYFEVTSELPLLTGIDSDGDLIPDQQEGYSDEDQDGIPDYLDAINECNVLPERADIQNAYLVEGDPGVCLRKGVTVAASEAGGAMLTSTDLQNNAIASDELPNVGGIFDFIATGLPVVGQSYRVVLPQRQPIPAGATYRKYSDVKGWTDFVEDSENQLHSAAGQKGYCPPPASEYWTLGLTEGHWCVQLTISDGGANDDDGIANGTIVDPGGVAALADNNTPPQLLADSARLMRNEAMIIDVLANDTDIDNDELTLGVVTSIFGTVTITADNQLHYQAQTDFVGTDTVTYSVSDGHGGTSSATVSIEVFTNDAPQTETDYASTDDKTAITLDVLANDSDVDGDTLTIASASVDVGLVVINSDNTLTYTPERNFNGLVVLSYQVTDTFNSAVTGQVNIQVNGRVTEVEDVTVSNKSKGGSMGIMFLAIAMLLVLRRSSAQRSVGLLTLLFSLASFNASAEWFITGAFGKSTALENIDSSTIQGLDSIRFDQSDVSFRLGTGFNYQDFSFSLNYEQLGDTEAVISASTSNVNQFHQSVIDIAPKLVDGFSVQGEYRVWHNDAVHVAIGLGLLAWNLDYSSQLNETTIERKDNGTDAFYTATIGYQVLTDVEVNVQATRYHLPFNDVNNLSLGVRYSF